MTRTLMTVVTVACLLMPSPAMAAGPGDNSTTVGGTTSSSQKSVKVTKATEKRTAAQGEALFFDYSGKTYDAGGFFSHKEGLNWTWAGDFKEASASEASTGTWGSYTLNPLNGITVFYIPKDKKPGKYTITANGTYGGKVVYRSTITVTVIEKKDDGGKEQKKDSFSTDPKAIKENIDEIYNKDDETFWMMTKEELPKAKNGNIAMAYLFAPETKLQAMYGASKTATGDIISRVAAAAQKYYNEGYDFNGKHYDMRIWPSVILAQGAEEGGWFRSPIAQATNNYWGLTASGKGLGQAAMNTPRPYTTPYPSANIAIKRGGDVLSSVRWYVKFTDPEQSVAGHTIYLKNSKYYKMITNDMWNRQDIFYTDQFHKAMETYYGVGGSAGAVQYSMRLAALQAKFRAYDEGTLDPATGKMQWKNDMSAQLTSVSGKIGTALDWWKSTADDNSHGYSQSVRTGPSYDCSSFVFYGLKSAGMIGGSYPFTTSSMGSALVGAGFEEHDLSSFDWKQLKPGDILWRSGHTEAVWSVDASQASAKKGVRCIGAHSARGTHNTADDSGTEISIGGYSRFTKMYRAKG